MGRPTAMLDFLQALVLVGTLVGGGFTVFTYWRNSRLQRAQWLSSLHEKFFEQAHYKTIRRIIDYEEPELTTIKEALRTDTDHELTESLVDYLNFFELIGSLWKLKQLSFEEIALGFAYYLERLLDFDFLMNFIRRSGFENLDALLAEVKRRRKPQRRTDSDG